MHMHCENGVCRMVDDDEPTGNNGTAAEITIQICSGGNCFFKGAGKLSDTLKKVLGIAPGQTTEDGRIRAEMTGCLGACNEAPAVSINGKIHGNLTPERLEELLKSL